MKNVDLLGHKVSIPSTVSTVSSCDKNVKILRLVPRKVILLIIMQGSFSQNLVIIDSIYKYIRLCTRSEIEIYTRNTVNRCNRIVNTVFTKGIFYHSCTCTN